MFDVGIESEVARERAVWSCEEAVGDRMGCSRKLAGLLRSPEHWVARKVKREDEIAQQEWQRKGEGQT